MDFNYAAGILMALLFSRAKTTSWSWEDYPNPQTDFAACGVSEPGWLCDPDNVLSNGTVTSLNTKIKEFHHLGKHDCSLNATFHPAIGVINNINGDYESDAEKLNAAQAFADGLKDTAWVYGADCDNAFVIVLLISARKVWTATSSKVVSSGLTDDCVSAIYDTYSEMFTDGYYGKGLEAMLEDYKTVLSSGTVDICSSNASVGLVIGLAVGCIGATVGVVLLVILVKCTDCCDLNADDEESTDGGGGYSGGWGGSGAAGTSSGGGGGF